MGMKKAFKWTGQAQYAFGVPSTVILGGINVSLSSWHLGI